MYETPDWYPQQLHSLSTWESTHLTTRDVMQKLICVVWKSDLINSRGERDEMNAKKNEEKWDKDGEIADDTNQSRLMWFIQLRIKLSARHGTVFFKCEMINCYDGAMGGMGNVVERERSRAQKSFSSIRQRKKKWRTGRKRKNKIKVRCDDNFVFHQRRKIITQSSRKSIRSRDYFLFSI